MAKKIKKESKDNEVKEESKKIETENINNEPGNKTKELNDEKKEGKIRVLRKEKNLLELEFIGEDTAYLYALREFIVKDNSVELCAVKKEHPQDEVANPKMLIKGENPIESLKKGLNLMIKETETLYNKVK